MLTYMVCRHILELSGSILSLLYSAFCHLHLVYYLIPYNRFRFSVLVKNRYTPSWILQLDTYIIHLAIDSTSYTIESSVLDGQVHLFWSSYCNSLHSTLTRSFFKKLITEIHYFTIFQPLLCFIATNLLRSPSKDRLLFLINALLFPSISLRIILIDYLFY